MKSFLNTLISKRNLSTNISFLSFLSYKYNLDFQKLSKDLEEFVIEEKDKLIDTTIEDDYKSFIDNSEKITRRIQ